MISPRHLPALCVLAGLALVPTVIHNYSAAVVIDGRRTEAIPLALAGYHGAPSDRNEAWGRRRFDSGDWTERNYTSGAESLRLTVVRSYDHKSLYHHPELAIAYGTSFERVQTQRLPDRPDVPVHVLMPSEGVSAQAMYVLHYDGRFVEDPVMFQIRSAGELLFSRRDQMTIFFVTVQQMAGDAAKRQRAAAQLLFAAIDAFLAQSGDRAVAAR
jgi:hypothetical protein